MSRQVLPIAGACVGGFFGARLSWWRRALIAIGDACHRVAKPAPRVNTSFVYYPGTKDRETAAQVAMRIGKVRREYRDAL